MKISLPRSSAFLGNLKNLSACSALSLLFALGAPLSSKAANATWNSDASTVWSGTANWLGGVVADGAGVVADFSQFDITNSRTVTIDGAVASRTVGSLLIGDFLGASPYTIASTGGGTLTFNNNGSTALLIQTPTGGASTFSAPIILADDLRVTNGSSGLMTFSGGITSAGSKNLTLNADGGGGITLSTGTTFNHSGTITNSGTGTGVTTISGIIGSNVTGVVQNSASSQMSLTGVNTFSGGVTIKAGTLSSSGTFGLGTGTLVLGGTSGSADATYILGNSVTITNPITVQAGSSANTLAISVGALNKAVMSGPITLNNNLTLAFSAAGGGGGVSTTATLPYLTMSGAIGGTGNVTLNLSGLIVTDNSGGASVASTYTISGAISTTGTLIDASTGSGWKTISGNISNISSLNQNSATSTLILSGTGTYTGLTNVNAGVLRLTNQFAIASSSAVTVAPGGTLMFSAGAFNNAPGAVLTVSGSGSSYSGGALESQNVTSYGGAIVLATDSIFSNSQLNTNLTLSGTVSGSGRTLTTTGIGGVALAGPLVTGAGALIKEGPGTLTLSGTNSFTGLTSINNGALLLSNTSALAGGGNITLNGGILRHNSTNKLDYANRIVNSTGPIAIDTNNQSGITYSSGLAASNTGGFSKVGLGILTLSGTNSYAGVTSINNGGLAFTSTTAIASGGIFVDAGGVLNQGGAYGTIQGWLNSGAISQASTGGIALTGNSSEAIDFTGYAYLALGASSAATYSGTMIPAGGLYRLGGGAALLTLSAGNVLTGTNGLVVGAKNGTSVSNGNVTITGSNNLTGATTVNVGTLTLSGTGSIGGSAVTANAGSILAVTANTAAPAVTRAASLALNNAVLMVGGNATANSTDTITGALSIASGNSTVIITPNAGKNALLTLGSYVHNAGGTVLLRGANLGLNAISSGSAGAANISIVTPNLVGDVGANTTDRGILVGAVGDTATAGTGFGATGGLLTYDGTNGVRLLTGSEYKNSIGDGQTQLDNVRLAMSTSGTAVTTLATDTTINSLSIVTSGTTTALVSVGGAGTLKLSSGVLYSALISPVTSTSTISNKLDFNGKEAVILAGGNATLQLTGELANTGGNGLTVYGNKTVTLSGSTANNTYTGPTTVNGGTLSLNKTPGLNAIPGDIVINSGGTLSLSASNQIIDSANVTVNGGTFDGSSFAETINGVTMNGGSLVGSGLVIGGNATLTNGATMAQNSVGNKLTVNGLLNLSDGARLTVKRGQSVAGLTTYDSQVTLNGGLNIANTTTGAYTPISFDLSGALGQKGGQLVLNGDVTFTGNSTNTNTTLIEAPAGNGSRGVIALSGSSSAARTFNIGDGAAAVDLTVAAPMVDGTAGASGLTKTGAGTMAITSINTYTGATTITTGKLVVGINGSIFGSTAINNNATFDVSAQNATSFSVASTQTLTNNGTVTGNLAVSGVLKGNGTVNGNVSVASGGNLAPGNSAGTQTINGSLSLAGGAKLSMELGKSVANTGIQPIAGSGNDYDQVIIGGAGNVTLGGELALTIGSGIEANDVFYLILNNGGATTTLGAFASITVGGVTQSVVANHFTYNGQEFALTSTADFGGGGFASLGGNDVALMAVPEPATYAMLLGGLGMLAFWQKLRRRTA